MVDYRNIDEDIKLFNFAKRYHEEEYLTIEQIKYIAICEGYTAEEVELAVNDYYWIYINSKILTKRLFLFVIPFLVVALFLIKFL